MILFKFSSWADKIHGHWEVNLTASSSHWVINETAGRGISATALAQIEAAAEFDWETYMQETEGEPAPDKCFKQVPIITNWTIILALFVTYVLS